MASTSGKIFQSSRANKVGLSKLLDTTLKTSHDMKIFGIGALAEFSSTGMYKHFLVQRFHFYEAMESRFDGSSAGGMAHIWPKFSADLRQSPCLIKDLQAVGVENPAAVLPAAATRDYVNAISSACENGLVGHFYCRYFADLFGGSMLGLPTSLALSVPDPQFYRFPAHVEGQRRHYIEKLYEAINLAGEKMDEAGKQTAVRHAELAFDHNAAIIKELGIGSVAVKAIHGAVNVGAGFVKRKLLATT
ncbi:unnamed protein product [Heterosigma akashiwo]|mmetsp:Transcript_14026/g.22139  ORF Transcript_14026/g.22139 Transcript_14026/m.22139 type:complete len:247 (+) Transcript_14026:143-883(+)